MLHPSVQYVRMNRHREASVWKISLIGCSLLAFLLHLPTCRPSEKKRHFWTAT